MSRKKKKKTTKVPVAESFAAMYILQRTIGPKKQLHTQREMEIAKAAFLAGWEGSVTGQMVELLNSIVSKIGVVPRGSRGSRSCCTSYPDGPHAPKCPQGQQ